MSGEKEALITEQIDKGSGIPRRTMVGKFLQALTLSIGVGATGTATLFHEELQHASNELHFANERLAKLQNETIGRHIAYARRVHALFSALYPSQDASQLIQFDDTKATLWMKDIVTNLQQEEETRTNPVRAIQATLSQMRQKNKEAKLGGGLDNEQLWLAFGLTYTLPPDKTPIDPQKLGILDAINAYMTTLHIDPDGHVEPETVRIASINLAQALHVDPSEIELIRNAPLQDPNQHDFSDESPMQTMPLFIHTINIVADAVQAFS